MCTYLNGILIAFTGQIPPGLMGTTKPVSKSPSVMVVSGTRESVRYRGDRNSERLRITHRGRNDLYKDRGLRAKGSGLSRAANTAF